MIDRNNYCKDCDRSIYANGDLAKSCDINIENNGYYNGSGEKCYCKIVNGKMAEKYPWEEWCETLPMEDIKEPEIIIVMRENKCNSFEAKKIIRERDDKLIKNRNKVLSKYPCDAFLHNALFFINIGKPDAAYREICRAILKNGGKLTEEEQAKFKERENDVCGVKITEATKD